MADYVVVDKEQLESDLTTVADAIREKGGTTELFAFPQGMADAVNALPDTDSGGSGMNEYIKYASVIRFQDLNLFGKNEVTFECDSLVTAFSMFQQVNSINVTVEHITVIAPIKMEACQSMFYSGIGADETLKRITLNMDFSECTSFTSVFGNLRSLEIIDGTPLDLRSATNFGLAFNQNKSLKEVRFAPLCIFKNLSISHTTFLSDTSIQSIIDGLADLTDETTQTITFHADVKAKLTEEQITTITGKNWTLA